MGRVGAAGDNAAMESFFSAAAEQRPQPPLLDNPYDLRIAIVAWIERTYHRQRRQARLGRLTPIEFETIMTNTVAVAA